MANKNDNLIPEAHKLTLEDQSNGGKRSGEVRREKATMKKTLEMLLETESKNGQTYRELATLGLIKGAMKGNAQNFRTILEALGELKQIEEDRQQREISRVEELLIKIETEAGK